MYTFNGQQLNLLIDLIKYCPEIIAVFIQKYNNIA